MRITRPVILFVLFGAGLGVVVADFAASQPRIPKPGQRRDIAPGSPGGTAGPPGGDQRPPDRDLRSSGNDYRPPDGNQRPPDGGQRPPGNNQRPPDRELRPPGNDQRPPDRDPRPPGIASPKPGIAPPPGAAHRAPVVTPPGWPLERPSHPVVVRPRRDLAPPPVPPKLFLPPIVFGGVVVSVRNYGSYRDGRGYSRDALVWKDTATLYREDEWTEFTLDCNARGTKLWFEVLEGRLQVDWAEVVFDTGEAQVVEFPERSLGRGIYKFLDFRDGRRVDYVRMVAKTTSREAKLTLWLER